MNNEELAKILVSSRGPMTEAEKKRSIQSMKRMLSKNFFVRMTALKPMGYIYLILLPLTWVVALCVDILGLVCYFMDKVFSDLYEETKYAVVTFKLACKELQEHRKDLLRAIIREMERRNLDEEEAAGNG